MASSFAPLMFAEFHNHSPLLLNYTLLTRIIFLLFMFIYKIIVNSVHNNNKVLTEVEKLYIVESGSGVFTRREGYPRKRVNLVLTHFFFFFFFSFTRQLRVPAR